MTTIETSTLPRHVGLADTVQQTMTMAWRATLKMRRNLEQFFDVTIQPVLFTAMFAGIFGGAISGSVEEYLPILIPGLIAQTVLTSCVATGTQIREDMDKGVFDRFKVLPISRIAPLGRPDVRRHDPLPHRGFPDLRDRHPDGVPPRAAAPSECSPRSCSRSSPAGRWPGSSPGSAPSAGAPRRCRATP